MELEQVRFLLPVLCSESLSMRKKEREKVMFDILSAICVECGKLFGGGDYCSDGLPYHTLNAAEAEAAEAAEYFEAEAEAEA